MLAGISVCDHSPPIEYVVSSCRGAANSAFTMKLLDSLSSR